MNVDASPPRAVGQQDRPLPANWTVRQALDVYMAENGFTYESYDARWSPASFLGVRFSVPNPPHHRWAIMRHDLHHVATGFGTDPRGEGEQAAWEMRRGLRPLGVYTGTIVLSAVLLGLVVAPRRTRRAWRASAGGPSLFTDGAPSYESILDMTLGELRQHLRVPAEGLARGTRGRHSLAPRH